MSRGVGAVLAAAEKADRVLAEHHTTTVPAAFFDEMLAALDTPGEANAKLTQGAVARDRTVTRR